MFGWFGQFLPCAEDGKPRLRRRRGRRGRGCLPQTLRVNGSFRRKRTGNFCFCAHFALTNAVKYRIIRLHIWFGIPEEGLSGVPLSISVADRYKIIRGYSAVGSAGVRAQRSFARTCKMASGRRGSLDAPQSHSRERYKISFRKAIIYGVIAQLVARLNGIQKVRGSTPLSSTKSK